MEFSRRVRISSALNKDWQEICEDLSMKAIPIKYVSKVELIFNNGGNLIIDVPQLLKDYKETDAAGKALEDIIQSKQAVSVVEYVIDFDKVKGEVAFSSSRLGNENNGNSNL
jgi:hypothetical protein